MASRTVKVLKIAFLDSDGVDVWADRGDTVNVLAGDVERFDRLNVLDLEPAVEPVESEDPPKRRPGRPRKAVDDSVRDD